MRNQVVCCVDPEVFKSLSDVCTRKVVVVDCDGFIRKGVNGFWIFVCGI